MEKAYVEGRKEGESSMVRGMKEHAAEVPAAEQEGELLSQMEQCN